MKCRLFVLLFSLLSFILTGSLQAEPRASAQAQDIRIGYLPVLSNLPIVLAYERDQYNLRGVNLRLYRYQSATGLEAAIRVGAIDLAILPANSILALAHDKIAAKALVTVSEGGSRLYRRQRSGDNNSLVDLTFGIMDYGTTDHLALARYLAEQQLAEGFDYHTLRVNFDSVLEDVQKGTIDAFLLPEPFPYRAATSLPGVWGRVSDFPQQLTMNKSLLVSGDHLLQGEPLVALTQVITMVARAVASLDRQLASGNLEQIAISPAVRLLLGSSDIGELLESVLTFTHFTFVRPELSELVTMRDRLWAMGLAGGDDQQLAKTLDLPAELQDLLLRLERR